MNLNGQVFFITGTTGGLGQQFVHQALSRGADKVYAAARREQSWEDPRVVTVELDVTSPASITAAAAAAPDVTVLINNAAITGPPSLLASDIEEIRNTFETNVFGPLELTRALAATLAKSKGGAVINVHSVLSWLAKPGAYSPSKSALWGVTNSLRQELSVQSTHVLGAHLAYAETPMTASLSDVPKADPAAVVGHILDSLQDDQHEAVVDETSKYVQRNLADLTTGVIPGH